MSRQDQSTLSTKTVTETVYSVAIDSAAVDTANQVAVATEGRLSEATHVVQAPIRGFQQKSVPQNSISMARKAATAATHF